MLIAEDYLLLDLSSTTAEIIEWSHQGSVEVGPFLSHLINVYLDINGFRLSVSVKQEINETLPSMLMEEEVGLEANL